MLYEILHSIETGKLERIKEIHQRGEMKGSLVLYLMQCIDHNKSDIFDWMLRLAKENEIETVIVYITQMNHISFLESMKKNGYLK